MNTNSIDLTGKFVWQVDYPNSTGGTQPTFFIEDPTAGMFDFAQDHPCRVRYLTDLVGELSAAELRELAIKAPSEDQPDDETEENAADQQCGASVKTVENGRVWCGKDVGHVDAHRSGFGDFWTD